MSSPCPKYFEGVGFGSEERMYEYEEEMRELYNRDGDHFYFLKKDGKINPRELKCVSGGFFSLTANTGHELVG